jgi:hypothetical protein
VSVQEANRQGLVPEPEPRIGQRLLFWQSGQAAPLTATVIRVLGDGVHVAFAYGEMIVPPAALFVDRRGLPADRREAQR